MTRLSRHHSIETHGGLSVMKSILSLFGVAALAASSAPALAQTVAQTTDDAAVDVIGNAEAICSLPTSWTRSEEHTSELQLLMRISYAVFCLKKKNKRHTHTALHERIRQETTHI